MKCEYVWRAGWAQHFVWDRVHLHALGAVHKNRGFSAWVHCAVFSVNGFHTLQWEDWLHCLRVENLFSPIASLFHVYNFLKLFTIWTGIFHASFASKGDYIKIAMIKEKRRVLCLLVCFWERLEYFYFFSWIALLSGEEHCIFPPFHADFSGFSLFTVAHC